MVSPRPTGNNGFTIEVGCPGCGADLALEQDFRLLQCHHCGSILRILMPDLPAAFFARPKKSMQEVRFLLERFCRENDLAMPRSSTLLQLTYYPYWKIDAVTLKVRTSVYEVSRSPEEETDDGSTDERELTTVSLTTFSTSVPATTVAAGVPYGLGVRTGYLGLVPFDRKKVDSEATCLAISEPFESAVERAVKATAGMGSLTESDNRPDSTLLFHPQGSIIFFPYYVADSYESAGIRRFAIDAVTGRVAGTELLSGEPVNAPEGEPIHFGALNVAFHRCSNCGVDMPMGRSLVNVCNNCDRVEFLDSHPVLNRELLITGGKPDKAATYFPFWVIRATNDQSEKQLQFVVPAFQMRNAETVYRLSSRMTNAIQHIPFEPMRDLAKQEIPVSRSIDHALALLEVLWYRRAAELDHLRNRSYQPCKPVSIQLLFAPFISEQYFYIDSVLKAVTFEKAGALAPSR